MIRYLRALADLNGTNRGKVSIEGKLFKVPAFTPEQKKIPFARVNHNKYMVTEKSGYIGTSNWEADYFINTGGIGFAFRYFSENYFQFLDTFGETVV
jgi:phospholipase D3/4